MSRLNYIATILVFLLLFTVTTSQAQQSTPRKKVGLVFGGGGAKGAAEVGVLKVLEEAGIPIDYIAGTSIGGLVGALYSIGYNANYMDSLFRNQDWIFLLSDQVKRVDKVFLSKKEKETYAFHIPFSINGEGSIPNGYVTGQNVLNLFTKLTTGYHDVKNFMDLPIPFKCVSVDIVHGRQVNLSSGSLPVAMRSTMSIPGVFVPVSRDSMLLIDGGALDNFPVDVVKDMGAEIIIGIDLTTGWKTKSELTSLPSMLSQLIDIMGEQKYRENRYATDLYINPPLKGYSAASFQDAAIDSMLEIGEKAARKQWDEIIALKKKIYNQGTKEDSVVTKLKERELPTKYYINNIKINGIKTEDEKWLRNKINLHEHSVIHTSQIDHAISIMQGMNTFLTVEYYLTDNPPYDLVFELTPKNYKALNIGIRFDTEAIGSLLLNASNDNDMNTNYHYSVTGRISKNPYLKLQFTYGNFFNHRFSASYMIKYNDFGLYSHTNKLEKLEYASQHIEAYYSKIHSNFRIQGGVQFDFFNYNHYMYLPDNSPVKMSASHFINYFGDFLLDTYNKDYFATVGTKANIHAILYTKNGLSYKGGAPFGSIRFNVEKPVKLTSKLYLMPLLKGRFLIGNDISCYYQNYLGGIFDGIYFPQQESWETDQHTQIVQNSFIGARLNLRYQLKDKLYITALSEYGKESHSIQKLISGKDIWGYGLRASYDLLFGPLSLQVNYSSLYKNMGIYLNAGFYF